LEHSYLFVNFEIFIEKFFCVGDTPSFIQLDFSELPNALWAKVFQKELPICWHLRPSWLAWPPVISAAVSLQLVKSYIFYPHDMYLVA